jgi:hypothetical protein
MKGHNYDHHQGDICKKCGKVHPSIERSAETRMKSRLSHLGIPSANKGHHQIAWNKGLTKETSESVQKYANQLKGRSKSETTRKKISESLKGKPSTFKGHTHTTQTKAIMRQKHLGAIGPWKGKHLPESMRKKMGETRKARGYPSPMKGKHPVGSEHQKEVARKLWKENNPMHNPISRRKNAIALSVLTILKLPLLRLFRY